MKSALHQHTGAAERDRLVDLLADLVERPNIRVRRAGPAIERAEGADHVADVRVVDVSIDDVRDHVSGMTAGTNLIRGDTHAGDVVRLEQRRAFFNGHAFAREHSIENRLNTIHEYLKCIVTALLVQSVHACGPVRNRVRARAASSRRYDRRCSQLSTFASPSGESSLDKH